MAEKSFLEELLGPSYEDMSDEELEQLVMTGRMAREEASVERVKAARATKVAAAPRESILDSNPDFDFSDFE